MTRERGFTLIELIMAIGLSSLVLVALFSLSVPMARTEISSIQSQTAQLNVAGAMSVFEREVRQATYLKTPAAGASGGVVEGCSNAAVLPGAASPTPLDASQPMHWFAFCADASLVYYHAGSGACPPSYLCGTNPTGVFGGGRSSAVSAVFSRPSALTTVVQATFAVTSGAETSTLQNAVSYSAAAGTNQ